MKMSDVRPAAFAIPLIITDRIDPNALAAVVPEPLQIGEPPAGAGGVVHDLYREEAGFFTEIRRRT